MSKILIVDDEAPLRRLLTGLLTADGFAVETAATGAAGIQRALDEPFGLIILDLNLPDLNGEQVAKVILAVRSTARIIVLSAAPDVGRRVNMLEGGAADFVAKPFVNSELLARVRLRIRETAARQGPTRIVIDADVHLDVARRQLVIGDQRLPLSQREFALLNHLLERRGATCTRAELLADVWGLDFDPGTNVVDVYIGRLRAKLAPVKIETVRNAGYRLAAS